MMLNRTIAPHTAQRASPAVVVASLGVPQARRTSAASKQTSGPPTAATLRKAQNPRPRAALTVRAAQATASLPRYVLLPRHLILHAGTAMSL